MKVQIEVGKGIQCDGIEIMFGDSISFVVEAYGEIDRYEDNYYFYESSLLVHVDSNNCIDEIEIRNDEEHSHVVMLNGTNIFSEMKDVVIELIVRLNQSPVEDELGTYEAKRIGLAYSFSMTDEKIEEMIQAAIYSESWKNSQTPRYHVIQSKEMLEQFKKKCLPEFNQKNVADAPILIVTTFVKDRAGFQRNGSPDNELQNGWGVYDCGLANQNLILKATELGLGTLVMGIRDERTIREFLEIPAQETIVSVIGVGYPDIEPSMPKRKTIEEVSTFY